MDRPISYTSAMTNLKWDNSKDYTAIQEYINKLRTKIIKLEVENKRLLKRDFLIRYNKVVRKRMLKKVNKAII